MSREPYDEYLWLATGAADDLVRELESLLAPLRFDAAPALPARDGQRAERPPAQQDRMRTTADRRR